MPPPATKVVLVVVGSMSELDDWGQAVSDVACGQPPDRVSLSLKHISLPELA